jgi:membrane protein DedA with SNARE-associated domain
MIGRPVLPDLERVTGERQSGRRWLPFVLAGVLVVVLVLVVLFLFSPPLRVPRGIVRRAATELIRRFGPAGAVGLLYLEESGVPLPVPGDVYVLYLGDHFASQFRLWVLAWLAIIVAVVLGATNLYLISRQIGRRLIAGSLGALLHVTPQRLDQAEAWFHRWGPWALIFGRHIPGGRIPITIAAGLLRVNYPVFAACVAVSTAIWAGAWFTIGHFAGRAVERWIRTHPQLSITIPIVWVSLVVIYVVYRVSTYRSHSPPEDPVEQRDEAGRPSGPPL